MYHVGKRRETGHEYKNKGNGCIIKRQGKEINGQQPGDVRRRNGNSGMVRLCEQRKKQQHEVTLNRSTQTSNTPMQRRGDKTGREKNARHEAK